MCFTFMITLILSYCGKEKEWGVVAGLNLNGYDSKNLTIVDCNGKLAFLWHEPEKMEIWCTMIALRRRGVVGVQGRVEWSNCLLSDVPPDYKMIHCLGGTD
ncbi:hypothetical protein ARALYDRAFT_907591 [Arabidopsis lyrata subsp. lyrata]|uniref:F-box associated domain-containing protein n=1 Tax=Arabidopsis lyrata subsp. lyrata TaxID=81972 RepID=D7LRS6_ARALL|nr:hypothetical protein ARALYDRAFT_907591 [Arabidopsis lyrata subsp. lyrata]